LTNADCLFQRFRGQPFVDWVDPTKQLHNWQGLRDALNKTGHPIYYSICPHGHVPPDGPSAPWYKNGTGLGYTPPLSWTESERKETANSLLVEYTNLFDFWYADYWEDFRSCGPTKACPTCIWKPKCSKFKNGTTNPAVPLDPGGFLTDVDAMVQLTKPEYSGPGTWADADMLQVCNYGQGGTDAGGRGDDGMTLEEYRASYSIWAMFASPIIISANLMTLEKEHPECLAMLKNKELLAISQDPLGIAGKLVRQITNATDPLSYAESRNYNIVEQVFVRELVGGVFAVVLFNRAEEAREIAVTWAELGMPSKIAYAVRDIWANNVHGANVDLVLPLQINDSVADRKMVVGFHNGSGGGMDGMGDAGAAAAAAGAGVAMPSGYTATVPPHNIIMITATPHHQ